MQPRIIVVISQKGVEDVRLVSSQFGEEGPVFSLYEKASGFLKEMDSALKKEGEKGYRESSTTKLSR